MRKPSSFSISRAQAVAGDAGASSSSAANKSTPCCNKVGLKRGPWTPEEDELLANYIKREGEGRWRTLPKKAGLLRCGKSCRLRWMNYLRPSVKRGHIAPDEEDLILRLHRLLGNRWSLIAGRIPGRTDNEIKNYWNTHLSKKLISQGIDPRTHKPLEPNSISENKASTSRENQIPIPSTSNIYIPSLLELDTTNMNSQATVNHGQYQSSLTVENGNLNAMRNAAAAAADGNYGLELRSSHEGQSNDEVDDQEINYCTDDVFSTFLNSLINEDVLLNSQNLVQQHQHAMVVPNTDPLISSTQAFTFAPGWDAPIMASTAAFDQNDLQRLNHDQVEKRF